MRGRTIVSCMAIAGAALAVPAGSGAAPAAPAAPTQAVRAWDVLAGNFAGDERAETFWYFSGGTNDDLLISSTNNGDPTGTLNETVHPFSVTRAFDPFAGDFDGDGYDEIFWYAPGPAPDSIWSWPDDNFTQPTSRPISVSGTYQPLVGDYNGDDIDDVLWYAPGSTPDSLWYFLPGGSHVSVTHDINRTYRPVVASMGKDDTDDIAWYAPGKTTDIIWDFTVGTQTFTTRALVVDGTSYWPFAVDTYGEGFRGNDVWYYSPGSSHDELWDYYEGALYDVLDFPITGNWQVATGDFMGDGLEDVYLSNGNVGWTLRNFFGEDQGELLYVDYHFRYSSAQAASSEVGGSGAWTVGPIAPSAPHTFGATWPKAP